MSSSTPPPLRKISAAEWRSTCPQSPPTGIADDRICRAPASRARLRSDGAASRLGIVKRSLLRSGRRERSYAFTGAGSVRVWQQSPRWSGPSASKDRTSCSHGVSPNGAPAAVGFTEVRRRRLGDSRIGSRIAPPDSASIPLGLVPQAQRVPPSRITVIYEPNKAFFQECSCSAQITLRAHDPSQVEHCVASQVLHGVVIGFRGPLAHNRQIHGDHATPPCHRARNEQQGHNGHRKQCAVRSRAQ